MKQNLLDLGLVHLFKMSKYYLITLLLLKLFISSASAEIVYIDINFILNSSDVGKSLNKHINEIMAKNNEKYKIVEEEIIKKEKSLIAQQNILDKNEFQKKLNTLSDEIKKFRADKKESQDEVNNIKITNTKKIIKLLNPIIKNYVNDNSISLVIPKKNIIIGKKNLDITNKIVELLNIQVKNINF